MSYDEIAIRVRDLSKHYLLFNRPEDRLKQMVVPRLQRLVRREPQRYYRNFAALNGVSFEVKRGEMVGIIGRNGSGKSTLLQIVCGTLQPSSGTVEVNGRIAALLELGAGFSPEFTGRENVYMNGAILGLARAEIDARFDAIAAFADIGDFIEQPVKTYSSGMYVRLAFATAINVDPDILVVDEALAVGDEAFQRKCFARIECIKDKGGTILFVSHGAQTIVQLCNRAMLIDCAELILEGRPKTVVTQYQRLISANANSAPGIRKSIIETRDAQPKDAVQPTMVPASNATRIAELVGADPSATLPVSGPSLAQDALAVTAPTTSEDGGLADEYDPNLVSQSTVCREEHGARIRNVRITTLDGKPVNILRMGRRYVFEYQADFIGEATNVGFEMLFKTIQGVVIAGNATYRSRTTHLDRAAAQSTARVRTEFTCTFLPGFYLGSCGIWGQHNAETGWLHKIVDGLAIRVAPEPDLTAIGITSIDALTSLQEDAP